ncbi:class I SAM-dependent methyltransferase [Nocardia sp. CDC160]|uniref:class I SAM-dependent methyltransferase n=1 Tax=Nocardia sp. CDC160 TaxID=3112166 RepID=UPI002DB9A0C3|nr:class I SAM-dependent methyltransferase [Nocardia sp. CDC160]MEC3920570.1 class I SAM-dependent methyltransferase [Nocardia sp. CDC160]
MSESGRWEVEDLALRARRASSFGAEAAAYDEHRPDYPIAGVRWAVEPLGTTDIRALDLAAGTGKLTGVLLTAGLRVTAVEPDEAMRAILHHHYPDVTALPGTAESIPLPSNSIDAILVGQALHWFNLPRAFPEMARVLRPGGVLAAFWNEPDMTVEWVAELHRLTRSNASFPPATQNGLPTHPLFTPFEQADFPHTHRRTADSLTATIGTHSHTLVIPPEARTTLLTRLSTYLHTRPETATGEFDMPLRTTVIRAVVRDDSLVEGDVEGGGIGEGLAGEG